MSNLILRPDWHLPERLVTSESAVRNRRQFLLQLGFASTGLLAMQGCGNAADAAANAPKAASKLYPPTRNISYDPGWTLTDEKTAATYNNFYEFTTQKDRVHQVTAKFEIDPWAIEIGGLVEKPLKLDARELLELMGVEERVYRFRCVEAWAMIVPWTGFQLSKLLDKVVPKAEAKFVKFVTANKPEQMPGIQRLRGYPWPYTEGLRLDEAMNPLTLVASGIFGKPLPKQHGAPLRIVVPWKYGYKSIKSIVKIELTASQPATLWETLSPEEYPFESNVNPAIPHPRWSQASERLIDTGDRVRTLPFNGYAKQVASLYKA